MTAERGNADPLEGEPAEGIVSLPNALTLVRLPMAALVWVAPASMPFMLSVIAAAAVTDVVDGSFARALRRRRARRAGREPGTGASDVGAWLDPVCDKTFVLSVVIAVSVAKGPPVAVVALIAARDLGMIPLVAVYRLWPGIRNLNVDLTAGAFGKLATISQFAAIIALLKVPAWMWPLAYAAAGFGIAAVTSYFLRALRAYREGDYVTAPPRAAERS